MLKATMPIRRLAAVRAACLRRAVAHRARERGSGGAARRRQRNECASRADAADVRRRRYRRSRRSAPRLAPPAPPHPDRRRHSLASQFPHLFIVHRDSGAFFVPFYDLKAIYCHSHIL
jgi:hypothetical protein